MTYIGGKKNNSQVFRIAFSSHQYIFCKIIISVKRQKGLNFQDQKKMEATKKQ